MGELFSAFGFGLDSLLAGLIVGSLLRSWHERFGFALAFGVFDSVAGLAAPIWPHRMPEPLAWASYLLCVCLLAAAARHNRILFYFLPLVLSVDNLFVGAPAGALRAGVGSALLALAGLSLAALVRSIFSSALQVEA